MRRSTAIELPLWSRAFLALVLGLALTFGAVAPHDPASEHRAEGGIVDQAAQHPEDPPHFEASEATYLDGCQTCLLHLQTGARLVAPPALLPEPVRGEALPSTGTAAVPAHASFPGPARAPPVSSPVLVPPAA